MLNKILFTMMIFTLVFSNSFIEIQGVEAVKSENVGPTSAPDIEGPKSGPPSREEINKLKYTLDPEFIGKDKKDDTGILEIIWTWFTSLF